VRRFILIAALAMLAALAFAGSALAQGIPQDHTPTLTDDLGSWAALVGIVLPPLAALLQRDHWPDWVNSVIFAAAVIVASVVYGIVRFGDSFTWTAWEGTLLAVVVWGIFTYKTFWRPGTSSVIAKVRAIPRGSAAG
jgi:hypothetical protein